MAPELLGKVFRTRDGRAGRIVETEAYCGSIDAAAHTFRGKTARNAVMFERPGMLYVYFTYGMHFCCNPVCGEEGEGVAVLLRALAPIAGLELMRAARPRCARDRDLCRGPARLCAAMGIGRAQNGLDLAAAESDYWIEDDGAAAPETVCVTPRIGIRLAADKLWRWHVAGSPHVSGRLSPVGAR